MGVLRQQRSLAVAEDWERDSGLRRRMVADFENDVGGGEGGVGDNAVVAAVVCVVGLDPDFN